MTERTRLALHYTLSRRQNLKTQIIGTIDNRLLDIRYYLLAVPKKLRKKDKSRGACMHACAIVPLDNRLFEFDLASFTNQMLVLQERLENRRIALEKQKEEMHVEKDQKLLKAEEDIQTLRLAINFVEKRKQLSNLKNVLPDAFRHKKKLEVRLDNLQKYSRNLKNLCKYLEKSRTKAAREILDALKPQMNLIYTRLRPHLVYGTLDIEVRRGRGRAGKRLFSYMIQAVSKDKEKKTFVKTRFSHAQMNVTGLSIFLALVLGAPHKFETIMLDEPDQSLDYDHKENLAAILRDLQNYKQIIVATQDEDFQKILLDRLAPPSSKSRVVYNFYDWEPKYGPKITRSIHEAPKI